MKRAKLQLITLAVICALSLPAPILAQDRIFSLGELSNAKNHTGDVWLKELNAGDAEFDPGIATATFGAGARLDWHVHPGGQALLITEGNGYYQERGQPARIVRKGEVVKSAPGVEHWHGATPDPTFTYIAVTPTRQAKTIWRSPSQIANTVASNRRLPTLSSGADR